MQKFDWELYNLKDDPGELDNLYNLPEEKAIITKLENELKDLRTKFNEQKDE